MSETRQVKWVEEPCTKIGKQCFYPGDVSTLDKAEADQYINAGWCECVATGETGTRVAGHKKMDVQDTFLALS